MADSSFLHPSSPKPLEALIEEARLATLDRYRALPDADIAGLSRVSSAAAQSFGATQAAISFVDDSRVWFGGAFGFNLDDTSRESSFCDVVVRSTAPLMVLDGLVDPRFWNHELVRGEMGLRSYAGVPLIDGGGYTLGTVAVYSVTPGRFSTSVLTELASLATLVRDFLFDARERPREPAAVRRVQGWLGVKTAATKAGEAMAGLIVLSVAKGSPAADAGLRPTDILHSIGGQAVCVLDDITAALGGRAAGTRVPVRLRRGGRWHECDVEIRAKRRLVRVR